MLDTYVATVLDHLDRAIRDAEVIEGVIDAHVGFALGALAADLGRRTGRHAELARLAPTIRVAPPSIDVDEALDLRVVPAREQLRRRMRRIAGELRRIAIALGAGDDVLRAASDDLVAIRLAARLGGTAVRPVPAPPPAVENYCWMRIR